MLTKAGAPGHIVTVDSLGSVGEFTSLALDGSGNPRISYHGNSNLKYASCDTGCDVAGNWTVITVDSSASDVGEFTSLALDSSGNPRISYKDATNNDLKYAFCTTGCSTPTNWTKITLDRTGNTGWDTSLALTTAENPRIAYYRFDSGDLKYAWCDVSCATQPIGIRRPWTAPVMWESLLPWRLTAATILPTSAIMIGITVKISNMLP